MKIIILLFLIFFSNSLFAEDFDFGGDGKTSPKTICTSKITFYNKNSHGVSVKYETENSTKTWNFDMGDNVYKTGNKRDALVFQINRWGSLKAIADKGFCTLKHTCESPYIYDSTSKKCVIQCTPLSDTTVPLDKDECVQNANYSDKYIKSGMLSYQECDNTCYVLEAQKKSCEDAVSDFKISCDTDLNIPHFSCTEQNSTIKELNTSCTPKENNISSPCQTELATYTSECHQQGKDVNGTCVDNGIFVTEDTYECVSKPNNDSNTTNTAPQANNDSNTTNTTPQANNDSNTTNTTPQANNDSNTTNTAPQANNDSNNTKIPDNGFSTFDGSGGSWMSNKTQLNGNSNSNDKSNSNNKLDNNNSNENNSALGKLGEFANKALSFMGKIGDLLTNPSSIGDKINNSIDNTFNEYGNRDYTDGLANRECGTIPEYSTVVYGKKITIFSQATIDMMPMNIFKSVIIFMFVFSAVVIVFKGV